MTVPTHTPPPPFTRAADKAIALALCLGHAEKALDVFTSGQVDAIVDPDGRTYLLRSAQEHMRQNEKRLQAVIESAADVITVVDREGAILSQNRAVSRVLGYEPDELVGCRIFELIHESDMSSVHSAFCNVIEGFQENATTRFRHRVRDGSYRLIEATVGKLGDFTLASGVFSLRPISSSGRREPAQPEAELGQSSLLVDRFLAMLSHELRTPITPVLLGVDELQGDERFAEARPTLLMIRRNVELELCLLEELMDFTTVGAHKVRLRPKSIDAHEQILFVLEKARNST